MAMAVRIAKGLTARGVSVLILAVALGFAGVAGAVFTDVAAVMGVDDAGSAGGVAWGDYNNDLFPDLAVARAGDGGVLVYPNIIGVLFPAPENRAGGTSVVWGDYDNDGLLDLVSSGDGGRLYRSYYDGGGVYPYRFTFQDRSVSSGINSLSAGQGLALGDANRDSWLDVFVTGMTATTNGYFVGSMSVFTESAAAAGIQPRQGGTFATTADLNGDGRIDFIVHGDTPGAIGVRIYQAKADGTGFDDKTAAYGLGAETTSAHGSVALADYDNDGDLDLYMAKGGVAGNKLYRWDSGPSQFVDVTVASGTGTTSDSAGVAWGDYDNDGHIDLFVANRGQADILYRNNGDGTFTDVAVAEHVNDTGAARGAAWADFDLDGDLDLFVTREGQANLLYRNDLGNANYLRVIVHGTGNTMLGPGTPERYGLGAKIRVFDGLDQLVAYREVGGGMGHGSQNWQVQHFGLDPSQTYTVKAQFLPGNVAQATIVPNATTLLGWLPQTIYLQEPSDLTPSLPTPPHIEGLELFYNGKFGDAADPAKQFLAVGEASQMSVVGTDLHGNVTNYGQGITGIRVTFDTVVTFSGGVAAAFSYEATPEQSTDNTFTPFIPSPAPAYAVDDSSGKTVVTITFENEQIINRWLKTIVDASQVSVGGSDLDGELPSSLTLPSGDGTAGGDAEFIIGNRIGDVDGNYRTLGNDAFLIRNHLSGAPVPISNAYDIDKSGRVLGNDALLARAHLSGTPLPALP